MFPRCSADRPERGGGPAGHAAAAAQRAGVLALRRLAAVQKPAVGPQEEGGGEDALSGAD